MTETILTEICRGCKKNPSEIGRVRCYGCILRDREQRKRLIANRVCLECHQPATRGRQVCRDCAARRSIKAARKRKYAKRSGICCRCLARPKIVGSSRCAECLERLEEEKRLNAIGRKCSRCKGPRTSTISLCDTCLRIRKNLFDERRRLGLCRHGPRCVEPTENGHAYCAYHMDAQRESKNRTRRARRRRIVDGYGGRCACCGETEQLFLTIDHVNNDGAETRGWSASLVAKILREEFPSEYQLLCYNCNCTKGFYGECPHKAKPKPTKGKTK